MGNRPINRRPFKRRPWAKSRRATQWFDGLSAGATDREDGDTPFTVGCIIPQVSILCDPFEEGAPRSYIRTVWAGPTDADHLDSANALIERIVGSVQVRTYITSVSPLLLPIVRLGLLAVEEIPPGDATELQYISLFDNGHLERYEWMWLHQVAPSPSPSPVVDSCFSLTEVPIDSRVRRSLGKQDAVLLYASYVIPLAADTEPPVSDVHIYPMLRVLHSTK